MRILAEALTYDDVYLVPAHSTVLPRDVDTSTRLTRDIRLNVPIVSAAMDTVTEARLAITMAQCGGIGIIHKNMTAEQQAAEVRLVKKFEAGVIRNPITVGPDTSISEVMQITRANSISGVPVVEGDELVGIVTSRDLRFEKKPERPGAQHHDAQGEAGHGQGRAPGTTRCWTCCTSTASRRCWWSTMPSSCAA